MRTKKFETRLQLNSNFENYKKMYEKNKLHPLKAISSTNCIRYIFHKKFHRLAIICIIFLYIFFCQN